MGLALPTVPLCAYSLPSEERPDEQARSVARVTKLELELVQLRRTLEESEGNNELGFGYEMSLTKTIFKHETAIRRLRNPEIQELEGIIRAKLPEGWALDIIDRGDFHEKPIGFELPLPPQARDASYEFVMGAGRLEGVDRIIAMRNSEGGIVSVASLAPRGESGSDKPTIVGVYTAEDFRRKGYGEATLEAAVRYGLKQGFPRIQVDTTTEGGRRTVARLPSDLHTMLDVNDISERLRDFNRRRLDKVEFESLPANRQAELLSAAREQTDRVIIQLEDPERDPEQVLSSEDLRENIKIAVHHDLLEARPEDFMRSRIACLAGIIHDRQLEVLNPVHDLLISPYWRAQSAGRLSPAIIELVQQTVTDAYRRH